VAVNVVLKSVFDDAGIKNAQASFGKIGKMLDRSFMAIGATVAAAGVAVVAFGKQSIEAASNLEESTNAVNVAFGDAAEAILEIGKTSAKSLGVARTEFNQAAVRFSAFADRVVGQGGDVAGFIRDISQRASDFASVFNIEVSEALQVFQSGLAGEAEPLKRFGINLLDSEVKAYALANGIVAVGEQMTETQKVQARYGLLLQSTAKTAGDFANTSDGLANSQRILKATFTDLQAEIGSALLPTITKLVQQVAQYLLPKMQEFGKWLKSPEGQKAVADFGRDIQKLLEAMFDLFEYVKNNWDSITRFSGALLSTGLVIRGVIGAIQLMTAAQLALNVAVKANPYVLAVTALLALVSATVAFTGSTNGARLSAQKQSRQVEILSGEIDDLNRSFELGAIDQQTYDSQLAVLERTLNDVKLSTNSTAGELQRLNDLRLQSAIDEMNRFKLATEFATRQAQTFRDAYSYLEGIGAVTPMGGTQPTPTPTPTGGTGGGNDTKKQIASTIKDAQEQIKTASKRYRTAVKDARTELNKSTKRALDDYSEAVVNATKNRNAALAQVAEDNARQVAAINKNFSNRLADIVASSIARLRDAFRAAVQTNVADIFNAEETGKSVDKLVNTLRDRLAASKRLLENSAALSSAGFSQTFIEQVVGAGLTAGNELAEAVLNATPETQSELQNLFGALEKESETGMDALSQTIYDGAGLATEALRTLYSDTLTEQTQALADQSAAYATAQADILAQFDQAMIDAGLVRDKALQDAMTAYYDALKQAANDFLAELDEIEKKFKAKLKELGAQKAQIDKLQAEIDKAKKIVPVVVKNTPIVPVIPVGGGDGKGGNVINVNVKTDSTQSTTQVGKTIAQAVSKYVNAGGQTTIAVGLGRIGS
jgi:hypothetical protein